MSRWNPKTALERFIQLQKYINTNQLDEDQGDTGADRKYEELKALMTQAAQRGYTFVWNKDKGWVLQEEKSQ